MYIFFSCKKKPSDYKITMINIKKPLSLDLPKKMYKFNEYESRFDKFEIKIYMIIIEY